MSAFFFNIFVTEKEWDDKGRVINLIMKVLDGKCDENHLLESKKIIQSGEEYESGK